MIGRQIAHYEIREKLGQGGMGEVYRAHDSKLGRDVALKVLPEGPAGDPERRARFQREARSIAALKHPNIVTVHSVEEVDGIPFITMELVEGRSLSELIGSDGLRLDRFFEYAIPLADAIGWAHDRGITHRDLKPANIMIDTDGRLKILDFGLAKVFAPDVSADTAETVVRTHDTAAGRILGTPSYMSPEQAEGKPIDSRSDIFSLGIVLYEMATGKRPFEGDTPISTISSILKDQPKSVSDLRPANPRELGRIISHCLEKDPERRFQTAKDVRNELEGLRREVDSGEVVTSGQIRRESSSGLRLSRPMAIIGVVLGVAIAAGYLIMRNRAASELAGLPAPPRPGAPGAMQSQRQMAVVFPFQNLGPAEDAYFASGITEEINSRLASVSGIGIISRTTAENYDRSGKTTKQIGADLGVDYVLDGSVRWAKTANGTGRVRITPQLVRVSDDTPVWTENYDRELSDIFDVQTDIATHVVDALGVTLRGGERERLEERPTQNVEAYEAYLRAKSISCDFLTGCDVEVVATLEKAVTLDPAFLAAWGELVHHHSFMYHTGMDRTEARLARARDALEHAEAIDPSHPLTRLARGYYYYYGFRDYDRALAEFSAAAEARPNDAEAIFSVALIHRRQGDLQVAADYLAKAVELDPKNQDYLANLGGTYNGMRLYAKAHEAFERSYAINKDLSTLRDMATIELHATGDLAAARQTLVRAGDSGSQVMAPLKFEISLWEGDYAGARATLETIDIPVPSLHAMVNAWKAMTIVGESGPAAARPKLESSAKELEAVLATAPSDYNVRSVLALVYAYLGRSDDAIREGRLAVDLIAKDAYEGPTALENLAAVYANTGHADEALDLIERLLGMNYQDPLAVAKLRYQPQWIPLRENPRFKALLNRSS